MLLPELDGTANGAFNAVERACQFASQGTSCASCNNDRPFGLCKIFPVAIGSPGVTGYLGTKLAYIGRHWRGCGGVEEKRVVGTRAAF